MTSLFPPHCFYRPKSLGSKPSLLFLVFGLILFLLLLWHRNPIAHLPTRPSMFGAPSSNFHGASGSATKVVLLPDYSTPASVQRPNHIHVCIAISIVFDGTELERWLHDLIDAVLHQPPFVVHGVYIAGLWTHRAIRHLHNRRISLFRHTRVLVEECDVIIQTGKFALILPAPTCKSLYTYGCLRLRNIHVSICLDWVLPPPSPIIACLDLFSPL